jgi:hypothetical protein
MQEDTPSTHERDLKQCQAEMQQVREEMARNDAAQGAALAAKDAALAAKDDVIAAQQATIAAQQATIAALLSQQGTDLAEKPAVARRALAEAEALQTVTVAGGATTACASQPCLLDGACQNDGACVAGEGAVFRCECGGSFVGDRCEEERPCTEQPCQNGGVCSDWTTDKTIEKPKDGGVGGFYCQCQAGWEGTACGGEVDECISAPCLHGGACEDGVNGYTCECTEHAAGENCDRCETGFDGPQCEHDIDDCASGPCQHGGQCQDGVNGYSCQCTGKGYSGDRCETHTCCSTSDVGAQRHCHHDRHDGCYCSDGSHNACCSCTSGTGGCGHRSVSWCDAQRAGWDDSCDRNC